MVLHKVHSSVKLKRLFFFLEALWELFICTACKSVLVSHMQKETWPINQYPAILGQDWLIQQVAQCRLCSCSHLWTYTHLCLVSAASPPTARPFLHALCFCSAVLILQVYDGENTSSRLLGNFTRDDMLGHVINSTSNRLWLEFNSNASGTNQGFRLTYTSEFVGPITLDQLIQVSFAIMLGSLTMIYSSVRKKQKHPSCFSL